MRLRTIALAGAFAMAFGNAQAALFDRGNGLIYDSFLNVTWLADASLALTVPLGVSGIESDGTMKWNTVNSYVGALNSNQYLGLTGWRLPTYCEGWGTCSVNGSGNNELSHLFIDLGHSSGWYPLADSRYHDQDFSLVENFRDGAYWLADGSYVDSVANNSYSGGFFWKHAMFLRDGDIPAPQVSPVPEPETYAMMLAGLGLLGVVARRRKQKLNA